MEQGKPNDNAGLKVRYGHSDDGRLGWWWSFDGDTKEEGPCDSRLEAVTLAVNYLERLAIIPHILGR